MREQLYTLLMTFGFPVYLQGSMAQDEAYPEHFFTFWNNETTEGNHYDNGPISYIWSFDVNFYSIDPGTVSQMLMSAKALLKQNGWIISGKGHDVASDEPSHTGRGITALYVEQEGREIELSTELRESLLIEKNT